MSGADASVADDDRVVIEFDHVAYDVSTVDLLDENIRTTRNPEHRDALLEARLALYPSGPRLSPRDYLLKVIRQGHASASADSRPAGGAA